MYLEKQEDNEKDIAAIINAERNDLKLDIGKTTLSNTLSVTDLFHYMFQDTIINKQ